MSEQLMPNVITTLSSINDIAKMVLVLADNRFRAKAKLVQAFYQDKGLKDVEIYLCGDPNDYPQLRQRAQVLFDELRQSHPAQQLILNATGGTKPMSLAFTQVFDKPSQGAISIYTDTQNKRVSILSDEPGMPILPYQSVLDIEDYLRLNNFEVEQKVDTYSRDIDAIEERAELSHAILSYATQDQYLITCLNSFCQKTEFGKGTYAFKPSVIYTELAAYSNLRPMQKDQLATLFEYCQKAGLISIRADGIEFTSEQSAVYLGGAWFEELIYLAAKESGVEHCAMNVEGHQLNQQKSKSEANVKNELDVVLVNNNQIMLIEAKTLNWNSNFNKGKGQDTALKLDSLTHHLGGVFAKGLLASLFPFNDSTQDRLRNIRSLTPLHVNGYTMLVHHLSNWKKQTEQ